MHPLIRLLACAAACLAGPALAQDFPNRQLKIVVGQPPGTGQDLVARAIGPEMSKVLGQPILVENKLGAGGVIANEYVAKQVPADGYTMLLVVVSNLSTLHLFVKNLRFDPLKDLPPAMGLGEARFVFGSSSKTSWKTFEELLAHAKANPGKLNYGGVGTITRLPVEIIARERALKLVFVPYSAAAPFFQALLSGEVDMGFITVQTALSFGEKFKVLAQTGDRRHERLKEAPTFKELGLPQILGLSYSLNVPNGTPRSVIEKIHAAGARALQQENVRAALGKLHIDVVEQSPELAAKRLADEAKFYGDVVQKLGIQAQ